MVGMVAAVLVVLVIVLFLAAGWVGLLILRRSRPTTGEPPRTVGDLVRRRSSPKPDLSGNELFAPTEPRKTASPVPRPTPGPAPAVPEVDDAARTADLAVPLPATPAETLPGGVEVGDAPWRRAARMMGAEPGGRWETAPLPVVPEAAAVAPNGAGRTAVITPTKASKGVADDAGRTAVVPAPARDLPEPSPAADPAPAALDAPAGPALTLADPADVVEVEKPVGPAAAEPASVEATHAVVPHGSSAHPEPDPADRPDTGVAPSRPLSDPDLTPLMGIPIVRPLGSSTGASAAPVSVAPVAPDLAEPDPAAVAAAATPEPEPVPVAARSRSFESSDDDVVWMSSTTTDQPPAVTGSPQPVWFRVVRRDGEPVAGAVVALLDGHGREADVTKTATDGGGELHAPHGGRFLMITSADGYQPRAALLTVDEQPVEIALLLPRSASLDGVVRIGGEPAVGARVVAFQEGEVVDESVTDPGGGYRFADLAEGAYALSATHVHGASVHRVTVSEGADLHLDLDLAPPDRAR